MQAMFDDVRLDFRDFEDLLDQGLCVFS